MHILSLCLVCPGIGNGLICARSGECASLTPQHFRLSDDCRAVELRAVLREARPRRPTHTVGVALCRQNWARREFN